MYCQINKIRKIIPIPSARCKQGMTHLCSIHAYICTLTAVFWLRIFDREWELAPIISILYHGKHNDHSRSKIRIQNIENTIVRLVHHDTNYVARNSCPLLPARSPLRTTRWMLHLLHIKMEQEVLQGRSLLQKFLAFQNLPSLYGNYDPDCVSDLCCQNFTTLRFHITREKSQLGSISRLLCHDWCIVYFHPVFVVFIKISKSQQTCRMFLGWFPHG